MTAPICLVVEGKWGSKLGISSFICMVILIFLPPPLILPLSGNWGWCNFIPIWNMRLTPVNASSTTDWHWHSRNRVCVPTVQSSDYSYQGPSNDVFTIADYQHWVSNCDFNENWHETKSGKQCESVISAQLQSTITPLAYLGIFQIQMIKIYLITRIEEECIIVISGLWSQGLECGVSCFRSLYICVMQSSHTSCQHHRCHLICLPILTNQRLWWHVISQWEGSNHWAHGWW